MEAVYPYHNGASGARFPLIPFRGKPEYVEILSCGGWGNSDVYLAIENGRKWTIKTFASRNLAIRNVVAPFLIWRTLRVAQRLEGIGGVPRAYHRRGRCAYAHEHVAGMTLRDARKNGMRIPDTFFQALETLVREMHARGIVHADLRNARNIIITQDSKPMLIDFCSAVFLHGTPNCLSRLLCDIDLSGVYKHWQKSSPATLNAQGRKLLMSIDRLRPLWVFNRSTVGKMKRRATETGMECEWMEQEEAGRK